MSTTASWTHGNVTVLENPANQPISKVPRGWGAQFTFPASNLNTISSWLHIPIPTPVLISDQRASVFRFFLLFDCNPGAGFISQVQLYDGGAQIASFDTILDGTAFQSQLLPQNTFLVTPPHSVNFGLSISFLYETSLNATASNPPLLTVYSAGCDFTF